MAKSWVFLLNWSEVNCECRGDIFYMYSLKKVIYIVNFHNSVNFVCLDSIIIKRGKLRLVNRKKRWKKKMSFIWNNNAICSLKLWETSVIVVFMRILMFFKSSSLSEINSEGEEFFLPLLLFFFQPRNWTKPKVPKIFFNQKVLSNGDVEQIWKASPYEEDWKALAVEILSKVFE